MLYPLFFPHHFQVIGSRRASWRIISSIEQKGDSDKLNLIQTYKGKIEKELEDICSDILLIIKNELIPNTDSEEGKVFYHKMKGDYHRYLAEFQTSDVRKESAAQALEGTKEFLSCQIYTHACLWP